jgi:hypothetical protein
VRPRLRVSEQAYVGDIAVDATNVYWTSGDRAVMKTPITGGTAVKLAESDQYVQAIAVDESSVYWSTLPSAEDEASVLMKVSVNGGVALRLGEFAAPGANALAVDDENVYLHAESSIVRLPKAGGSPVLLASKTERVVSLVVDETHVYWTSLGRPTDPVGVAGSVNKVSIDGGAVTTLASRLGDPWNIVLVGSRVVWGQDYSDHRIMTIDKSPCREGACVE